MRKAIIISLKGKKLTFLEKKILNEKKPWGVILFKRNIKSFKQVKKLINDIKISAQMKNFPILIDEEGGTVSRLSKLIKFTNHPQKYFGDNFSKNKKKTKRLYLEYLRKMTKILSDIGVNINTVPVLDVLYPYTNKIIGSRSYSKIPTVVNALGKLCVKEYKKRKIGTVIKHIPGHGSSLIDSHKKLPIVTKEKNLLIKSDFKCFQNINSQFAMTAHILYKKIDKNSCATLSKKIIKNIIRKKIGFKGILISDDISMGALSKNIKSNALKAIKAGCNLVLYCAGKSKDSKSLCEILPIIDKFTLKKTSEFYKFLG
tara:strand:- start:2129 stop:3073 length:945 start_codon:yes stop_codon:yes gene_type:complete